MRKYVFLLLLSVVYTTYSQKLPWKTSSPEAQGMNSLTLINGINEMQHNGTNFHSLLIIRNNHIVLDAAVYPYRQAYPHDLASVTKSVMSLLIGIAIDEGFIQSDLDPVTKYFPEYPVNDSSLNSLTIKDLLNMASGFQCSSANGEQELEQMQDHDDWAGFMFNLPFSAKPGEAFSYCSGNFYLLAELLQRATKMTCHDFAKKYLFKVLNINKSYWDKNERGVNHGWGDLYLTPYDFAKLGVLLLQNGIWGGKQVVSAGWLQKILPLYPYKGTESYGYGWWLDSENPDEIQAMGRGGQRLFVLREKNTVVVTTGGGFDAGDMDDLAMKAIADYQKGTDHSGELRQRIAQLHVPDTGNNRHDNFSPAMLNQTFLLENNGLEITGFRFEKGRKDYYLILYLEDGGKQKLAMGLRNRYVISREHQFGLPLALRSYWDHDKLHVEYNSLSNINLYKFTFVFGSDEVDFHAVDWTNNRNFSLKGQLEDIKN